MNQNLLCNALIDETVHSVRILYVQDYLMKFFLFFLSFCCGYFFVILRAVQHNRRAIKFREYTSVLRSTLLEVMTLTGWAATRHLKTFLFVF